MSHNSFCNIEDSVARLVLLEQRAGFGCFVEWTGLEVGNGLGGDVTGVLMTGLEVAVEIKLSLDAKTISRSLGHDSQSVLGEVFAILQTHK